MKPMFDLCHKDDLMHKRANNNLVDMEKKSLGNERGRNTYYSRSNCSRGVIRYFLFYHKHKYLLNPIFKLIFTIKVSN